MTDTVTIRRELLERIDEYAICDGTDATISNDLFTELVAALAAPVQEPIAMLDLREAAIAASPWAEQAERTGAFVKGAIWHAMTYAAPVQGEAVAWYTEDQLDDKSATTWSKEVAERWKAKGWPVSPLYTTPPQPVDVGELVERMKDAERNEKHWNVQQTRYWCNQYKLLARAALARLEGKV